MLEHAKAHVHGGWWGEIAAAPSARLDALPAVLRPLIEALEWRPALAFCRRHHDDWERHYYDTPLGVDRAALSELLDQAAAALGDPDATNAVLGEVRSTGPGRVEIRERAWWALRDRTRRLAFLRELYAPEFIVENEERRVRDLLDLISGARPPEPSPAGLDEPDLALLDARPVHRMGDREIGPEAAAFFGRQFGGLAHDGQRGLVELTWPDLDLTADEVRWGKALRVGELAMRAVELATDPRLLLDLGPYVSHPPVAGEHVVDPAWTPHVEIHGLHLGDVGAVEVFRGERLRTLADALRDTDWEIDVDEDMPEAALRTEFEAARARVAEACEDLAARGDALLWWAVKHH